MIANYKYENDKYINIYVSYKRHAEPAIMLLPFIDKTFTLH